MDILFFVCISIFFFVKLKNVFGKRNEGDTNRKKAMEEFLKQKNPGEQQVKIINTTTIKQNVKNDKKNGIKLPEINIDFDFLISENVKLILTKINFNKKTFVKNAEDVVELVGDSFSNGDAESLKNVLEEKLFLKFKGQIDTFIQQKKVVKSMLISFLSSDIKDVYIDSTSIYIDIIFNTEQINFVEDENKNVIFGSRKNISIVKEKWTFERKLESKNNFWFIRDIKSVE